MHVLMSMHTYTYRYVFNVKAPQVLPISFLNKKEALLASPTQSHSLSPMPNPAFHHYRWLMAISICEWNTTSAELKSSWQVLNKSFVKSSRERVHWKIMISAGVKEYTHHSFIHAHIKSIHMEAMQENILFIQQTFINWYYMPGTAPS